MASASGAPTRKAAKRTLKRAAKRTTKRAAKDTKRAHATKAAPPAKKPRARPKASSSRTTATAKPAFGRTGTAGKAEGAPAVQAWIASRNPEHRDILRRLDALVGEEVPGVKRAIKWSSPMYGLPDKGWIASLGAFKEYVSLNFFAGTSLVPPPPFGESATMRKVNIHGPEEYDEKLFRSWIRQAAKVKGWGNV